MKDLFVFSEELLIIFCEDAAELSIVAVELGDWGVEGRSGRDASGGGLGFMELDIPADGCLGGVIPVRFRGEMEDVR